MMLTPNDTVYTVLWAVAGSTLGFFALRRNGIVGGLWNVVGQCVLSVGMGVLLSLVITEYLFVVQHFTKKFSMLLGALGAFGGPDFILRYWHRITDSMAERVTHVIEGDEEVKQEEQYDENHHPSRRVEGKETIMEERR